MKRVTIEVDVSKDTAVALAALAVRCNECGAIMDGFASHVGEFSSAKILAMLAEDAGKIVSQPESWQSSNMGRVLASHGYMIGKQQRS